MRILFLVMAVIFIASCDCSKVDCAQAGDVMELQIFHLNQNLFFGENASLTFGDISLFNTREQIEDQLIFSDQNRTVSFFMRDQIDYQLQIKGFDIIELSGEVESIGINDCCETFRLTNISVDNSLVCSDKCSSI